MKGGIVLFSAALVSAAALSCRSLPSSGAADPSAPPAQTNRSWPPERLCRAAGYAQEIGSAAVFVLEEGEVVFSYGDVTRKYKCHSIRKPFIGALYGIYPTYFFRMSTRDMARFGLLRQNYGRWEGRQVVPEAWVRESTAIRPIENASGDPYGYLRRIIPNEAGLGHGFYHAGLGAHLLAVLPDQKLVLVHRVDTDRDFDIRWTQIRRLIELIVGARTLREP